MDAEKGHEGSATSGAAKLADRGPPCFWQVERPIETNSSSPVKCLRAIVAICTLKA